MGDVGRHGDTKMKTCGGNIGIDIIIDKDELWDDTGKVIAVLFYRDGIECFCMMEVGTTGAYDDIKHCTAFVPMDLYKYDLTERRNTNAFVPITAIANYKYTRIVSKGVV